MSTSLVQPVALVLLRRAEHVLFAVLLVIGTIRAVIAQVAVPWVVVGAAALAGWYVLGMAFARRPRGARLAPAWLLVLTAGWVALLVASVDFVWLAFPLFFLYAQLLSLRVAIPAVTVLSLGGSVAIGVHRGQFGAADVLGPLLGAAVAVVLTVVYRDLRREVDERARLAERERLAGEIHDTVTQSLSSILLVLRAARDGYEDAPPAARVQVDTAITAAQDALQDTRRLISALAPAELDGRSLPEALHRLVADVTSVTDAHVVVDGTPYPVPTPVAVALLRTAQEAIANAATHAEARKVGLTLTFQAAAIHLDVVDDGRGFDPRSPVATTTRTGLGLTTVRSRLAEVGGTLVIESAPGKGTALSATVPSRESQP